MNLETVVHVRLDDNQVRRLDEICNETHLSRSQVIRVLIDQATIRPAIVRTEFQTQTQVNGN